MRTLIGILVLRYLKGGGALCNSPTMLRGELNGYLGQVINSKSWVPGTVSFPSGFVVCSLLRRNEDSFQRKRKRDAGVRFWDLVMRTSDDSTGQTGRKSSSTVQKIWHARCKVYRRATECPKALTSPFPSEKPVN